MKKKILLSFMLICISVSVFAALNVSAYTGTQYKDTPLYYEVSNNEVTITDCDSSATTIEISPVIDGKSVTSIGSYAFSYCSSLTNITIPDSVTSIGDSAFSGCSSLTSIAIPDSVTSIGEKAFFDTAYYDNKSNWENGVLYIGKHLINTNSNVSSEYSIKQGTKTIACSAFMNCRSLTNITIPDSITSISNYAFYWCFNLTSITIPNSVTSIGNAAFYDCRSLTGITIPDSVTSIGNSAFYDCSSLTSIIIPDSITSIGDSVFSNCSSLTSITIPDSITSIGNSAFSSCSSLTSITISDSVTSIGNSAFSSCSSLTSITIPDSVTSIDSYAFSGCRSLTSITIPDSITSIGNDAFFNCSSLESLYITDLAAYLNCEYGNETSNPMSYAEKLYINGKRATKVIIPAGVKRIPDCAFYNCDSLTSITIPDSVTSIGNSAFENCSSLTSIAIPDSVTSIGNSAFYSCSSLTSVILSNSVTSIGNSAFYDCSNLTGITIPDSVTSIGNSAFYDCSSLTSITIPDSVTNIGYRAFSYCRSLTSITIPSSVTSIGTEAFSYCDSLTSITIPDSITNIGDRAFYNCSSLTSATISNRITNIGRNIFSGCKSLACVIMPNSVTEIETDAFSNCPISIIFYTGTKDEWEETYIASGNDTLKQSDIVFNAVKKTYKFVTNCESVLPDITDYAVISSPAVKNSGKTLLGWYDNEGLTGNPVVFPYYGNATTLYAAWTDRTGASFDDAFEAAANQQYSVTAADAEQMIYYEFTPKLTGEYRFYTKGNLDTYGYLYNSEKRRLVTDDDSGESNNFKIVYNLTAGEKYYIAMKCYSNPGTFTFVTETDCFEGTKTVCVTASNGESIFVTIPSYLPQNAQIILACYEKGKLTETLFSPNKDETIYFIVSEKFDSAKVMVWESLINPKPVCDVEIVK